MVLFMKQSSVGIFCNVFSKHYRLQTFSQGHLQTSNIDFIFISAISRERKSSTVNMFLNSGICSIWSFIHFFINIMVYFYSFSLFYEIVIFRLIHECWRQAPVPPLPCKDKQVQTIDGGMFDSLLKASQYSVKNIFNVNKLICESSTDFIHFIAGKQMLSGFFVALFSLLQSLRWMVSFAKK